MTPEQARELNRIAVKTEGLQDSFADQGLKGLKISGQMDPTYIYNRAQDNASFVFLNNGDARYTYDNSYFGMAVHRLREGDRQRHALEADAGARARHRRALQQLDRARGLGVDPAHRPADAPVAGPDPRLDGLRDTRCRPATS